MNVLSTEEITHRARKYDEELSYTDTEIESRISTLLCSQNWLGKSEIADCIEWKLLNQGGRARLNVERLDDISEEVAEYITKAAFLAENPKQQVEILSTLPGVGAATSTVLLAFNDPENYAIGDRYMNDELLGKDKQITATSYPKLLKTIREIAPDSIPLRTVEKAYFQRYIEKNDP
ncbi:hypothetical protein GCM10008985_36770 [Halococcus dombrowskii]|uniref:Uncharacterized protein n=1 Tax=Halococcus dombrowskii TaxID=179637 RepID=A0AAV3SMD0_HALDO